MTNISYALDSLTREIRTGSDYFCGVSIGLPTDGYTTQDCSGESGFSFNEGGVSLTEQSSSRRVAYRLHNNVLERRLGNGNGGGSVNEPSDWLPVTAPEIVITDLRFYVTGSMRTNTESPTVTLYIAGTAGEDDGSQSRFNIQTTIVQQLLDI